MRPQFGISRAKHAKSAKEENEKVPARDLGARKIRIRNSGLDNLRAAGKFSTI